MSERSEVLDDLARERIRARDRELGHRGRLLRQLDLLRIQIINMPTVDMSAEELEAENNMIDSAIGELYTIVESRQLACEP